MADAEVTRSLSRILRPGGRLVPTTPKPKSTYPMDTGGAGQFIEIEDGNMYARLRTGDNYLTEQATYEMAEIGFDSGW